MKVADMADEIKRNIINEVAGNVAENVVVPAFSALVTAAGFPAAALAAPLVKGLVLGLVENCYNDCSQMTLSVREKDKLNLASRTALQTFRELAEKDGVIAWQINIDPSYIESAYEVAEHLTLEAIRQSETKKVEVLGHYYGSQFYKGNTDWHDMHQIITMAGSLTLRQLILIRLINEGFKGISPELFISNPSACVEINRMRDYGLWKTDLVLFENNASASLQIKLLKPTDYTHLVCEALMLETFSDDDIMRTIDSLALSDQGEPAEGISKEDYVANTGMYYDESTEGLTMGRNTTSPEDMAHVLRGKDLMKEATDYVHDGEYMECIDSIMRALMEFKQCKAEVIYQSSVNDALKELIDIFEYIRDKGGMRILRGKRQEYEAVLSDLRSEYLDKSLAYLRESEEREEDFDRELNNRDLESIFNNEVEEEKKKYL